MNQFLLCPWFLISRYFFHRYIALEKPFPLPYMSISSYNPKCKIMKFASLETRERGPDLSESNGDARSTYVRSHSLVGSLGLSCWHKRDFCPCLGFSSRPSPKYYFPHRTLFRFKLGRQSCRIACLLKVLSNGTGGGVWVVSIDRPFNHLHFRRFKKIL